MSTKRSTAPVKVFLVAGLALLSAGGAFAQQRPSTPKKGDYWDQRLDAIKVTLPENIRPNTRAAKTYEYWSRASQAITLCTDADTFNKQNIFQQLFAPALNDRVWNTLRDLPTQGVDPEAVRSVNLILSKEKSWEQATIAAFTTGINFYAGMTVGAALGADGSPPTPVDFGTAPLDGIGNVGQGSAVKGITKIRSASDGFNAMIVDMKSVEASLVATHDNLQARYHAPFPKFSITGKKLSGLCNYESGLF